MVIIIGLVALSTGGAYLAAGFLGCIGTVFTEGQLTVSFESFFRYASRNFGRILVLTLLFFFGSAAYWIITAMIAWAVHSSGILMGLWLFAAIVGYALLFLPVMGLGNAAAILDEQSGMAAFGSGMNTIRQSPMPTMGLMLLLTVLGTLVGLIGSQVFGPMQFLGSLIMLIVDGILGIYGQLVWFFYSREERSPKFPTSTNLSI